MILSPAQFVLYLDELLVELRSLGVGCKVEDMFMGAAGFCNDLFLLAPTRDGMQVSPINIFILYKMLYDWHLGGTEKAVDLITFRLATLME